MSSLIMSSPGMAFDDFGEDRMDQDDPLEPMDGPDRFEIFMPAVQSLVNALGGYEEIATPTAGFQTIYRPGDSVLAVLKDLKKLWRKDDSDDERTVARCMARAGLMKELLALLVECSDRGDWGRKVGLVACDLIAALTWPIDVQAELKELDDEPDLVTDYVSLLRAQLEYKALILQTDRPLRSLLSLMLPSLANQRKNDRDEKIISLGLHIIRNLVAIKDSVADGTDVGEKEEFANLQSRLLVQLNSLTYFQLLLTLASSANKTEFNLYNVIVLDILHLIFRGVKPKDLAVDQDRAPMVNLSKLLEGERRQKARHSKVGVTRHSRFGTTIAVKAGEQKLILHRQNAITVDAGKMLDSAKRKRALRMKKYDELHRPVELSLDAMRGLQGVAKTFLSSCFNTFFASILKDIRMERSKVRDTDNVRTFFLAKFFVDYLLVLREKQPKKADGNEGEMDSSLALGLVAELAEIDTVRWVVSRMRFTMEEKPPAYRELQACLDCFTQILLLIDAMAVSTEEEDVEVAEILQNRLYYNGDILDSSLMVISQYKDQSVAYLESVIHFAYVLLRMLEKYSKTKSFMFVRKRKAARRKRRAAEDSQAPGPSAEEYAGEEEEGMEPDKDVPSYAEHAFTFQSFEKRFANEAVVNTLVSYLSRYRWFDDPDQMKHVVGLMHRQVVKTQAEGLYFKVSCLDLFRHILDEQASLPKADSTKDLIQLIKFILRKFFKRVSEDPFLIVSALEPKSRSNWKQISSYKSDEESDDGMGGQKDRIREKLERAPAELEFKKNKNLSWSQQMGTVVAMLIQAGHQSWIEWVVEIIEVVHAARTEIVLAVDGPEIGAPTIGAGEDDDDNRRNRHLGGPSKDAIEKFEQHNVDAGDDERETALAKDAHLRLMLKLLSFDRTDEEKALEQQWSIPTTVLPSNLATSLGALRQYLASPPSLDEDPKSLLRKTRKTRVRARHDSDSEDDDQPRRIRKKKAAEVQIYKSAAFIEDSDDDEEADAAFFAREKALRAEMQKEAKEQGAMALAEILGRSEDKKRKRDKGKRKQIQEDGDDGSSDEDTQNSPLKSQDIGDTQPSNMGASQNVGLSDDERLNGHGSNSESSDSESDSDNPPLPTARQPKSRRMITSDSEED